MKDTEILEYDVAEFLDNDEMIAEYLTAALEEDDFDFFLSAFDDVVRAKGMSNIAKRSGLGRESLYKAFQPGSKPQTETILKVANAIGLKLKFSPN